MTGLTKFIMASVVPVLVIVSGPAVATGVASYELQRDHSGYVCSLTVESKEGPGGSINLLDANGQWSLNLSMRGLAGRYREFFDLNERVDKSRFAGTFRQLKIGSEIFDIDNSFLFAIEQNDVDARTRAVFEIDGKNNVTRSLEAMKEDGLSIVGLVEFENTVTAMTYFRDCALSAMRPRDNARDNARGNEPFSGDPRNEYRRIFERVFKTWAKERGTSDGCRLSRSDPEDVNDVIERAATAFYPGLWNVLERRDYRKKLTDMGQLAWLTGVAEVTSARCSMIGIQEDIARVPVDQVIRYAEELD